MGRTSTLFSQTIAFVICGILTSPDAHAQNETPNASNNDSNTPPTTDAPAQDTTGNISKETQVKEKVEKKSKRLVKNELSGTGLGIFGGADLAVIFTSPTSKTFKLIESSQLGFAPVFKFGGSVFTRRIILDLGLGLQFASYSGKIIALPTADDFGEVTFEPFSKPYTFSQTTMYVESGARLRIEKKFQLGLLANILFSTKSANFSSLPEIEPPEKYMALVGPQFLYETNFRKYISRFGASFLISLTGTNRAAYIANLHAGLGSFIINPTTVITKKTETRTRTKVTREVIQLKAQAAEVTDNVSFIFDSQMVNFKLNSAELNPRSGQFITALGEMFARENELWGKLRVEGHTDSRGSQVYNKKLSTLRARSVVDQLEKAGISRDRMEFEGLGASQLLVSPEQNDVDYARNRRVEIKILGLKDARTIRKYIEELQAKFFGRSPEIRAVPLPTQSSPDTSQEQQAPVWDPGLESENK